MNIESLKSPNERERARATANRWLNFLMEPLVEMVPGDPDCSACELARSYLRALEKIERLTYIAELYDMRVCEKPLAELQDEWPKAIQP